MLKWTISLLRICHQQTTYQKKTNKMRQREKLRSHGKKNQRPKSRIATMKSEHQNSKNNPIFEINAV